MLFQTRISTLAVIALSLTAAAAPISTMAAGKPNHPTLEGAMTGKHGEIRKLVPIGKRVGDHMKSVLSLRLPDLRHGSRITFNGEVTLSTTCVEQISRCIGRSYDFDPHLRGQIVLASEPDDSIPTRTMPVSHRVSLNCEQSRPNRNHHCPLVIDSGTFTVGNVERLPCAARRCRLNLLVDASNKHAGHHQFVAVGADQPNGTVEGGKARLNAAVSLGGLAVARRHTEQLRSRRLPASFDGGKEVIYSQRMGRLQRGDVLVIGSRQVSRIVGLPYFISDQIVISTRPNATEPSSLARRSVSRNGTATETNGFNCTLGHSAFSDPCVGKKAGLAVIERQPRTKAGKRKSLYINLVSRGFPKLAQARGFPAVELVDDGYLNVTRLRADR